MQLARRCTLCGGKTVADLILTKRNEYVSYGKKYKCEERLNHVYLCKEHMEEAADFMTMLGGRLRFKEDDASEDEN